MAKRRDMQKKEDELIEKCEAHSDLKKSMAEHIGRGGSEGLTKIFEKDLQQLKTEIVRTAQGWAELKTRKQPKILKEE